MTEHSTAGPLLGPAEIRELAETAGIRPTKTLGQNFVIDPNTIRRIVAAAHLAPEEHVLEVGPGLGSLTLGLLAASSAPAPAPTRKGEAIWTTVPPSRREEVPRHTSTGTPRRRRRKSPAVPRVAPG